MCFMFLLAAARSSVYGDDGLRADRWLGSYFVTGMSIGTAFHSFTNTASCTPMNSLAAGTAVHGGYRSIYHHTRGVYILGREASLTHHVSSSMTLWTKFPLQIVFLRNHQNLALANNQRRCITHSHYTSNKAPCKVGLCRIGTG